MIKLQKPSMELLKSYLEMMNEIKQAGEQIWELLLPISNESDTDFVNRFLNNETKPLGGLVPESTYWVTDESIVVGRIALRHYLNENLKEFGGHIGYEVRPIARRNGYATEMLRQILKTDKAKEIKKLLLTTAPNNVASIKVIMANGGVLEKTAFVKKWNRDTNYYWITL